MKPLCLLCLLSLLAHNALAQQPGILKKQKDADGIECTYVGQTSKGKPHGWGMAFYPTTSIALKYVGQFYEGLYSGTGVLFFRDGEFQSGKFHKGRLYGKSVVRFANEFLYVGEMKGDKRNGEGTYFFNNSFFHGHFVNDKLEGRVIYLNSNGDIISDIFYKDNLKNGYGYQYEVRSKTLFRGEWKNDEWVREVDFPGFYSFLSRTNFKGVLDGDRIVMGPTNHANQLHDSCFFYDLSTHTRYFGYFRNGKFDGGIRIIDDKSRFIGGQNEKQYLARCTFHTIGSHYAEGYYSPNGVVADYVLVDYKNDLTYFGYLLNDQFEGEATVFTKEQYMYRGNYKKNEFQFGYMFDSNGRKIDGWWKDGAISKVDEVIRPDGTKMFLKPETLEGLVNVVMDDHPYKYLNLVGPELEGDESDAETRYFESLISCPLFTGDQILLQENKSHLYMINYFLSDNEKEAITKYNELTKKLLVIKLTNKAFTKPTKFSGSVIPVTNMEKRTETKFSLLPISTIFKNFNAWVIFDKTSKGKYRVQLQLGTIK